MKFRYEGHDKMGRPLKGELEAANQESASSELREREIFALKLEPVTEDQMRTVLEHPDPEPPDVEAEIEKVRAEADEEMPPCPPDAHCPVCLDAEQSSYGTGRGKALAEKDLAAPMDGTAHIAELTDDLRAAVEISNQIENELGDKRNRIVGNRVERILLSKAALKAMVTEAALKALHGANIRRMPKGRGPGFSYAAH